MVLWTLSEPVGLLESALMSSSVVLVLGVSRVGARAKGSLAHDHWLIVVMGVDLIWKIAISGVEESVPSILATEVAIWLTGKFLMPIRHGGNPFVGEHVWS